VDHLDADAVEPMGTPVRRGRAPHAGASDQADLDRYLLVRRLRAESLRWLFETAWDMWEIQEGARRSGWTADSLWEALARSRCVVTVAGREFEAVYRFVAGRYGTVDTPWFLRRLRRNEWTIRWTTVHEIHTRPPETLQDALREWSSVVLRDGVLPELRRLINTRLPREDSTRLRIESTPGLHRVHDVSFTVATRSTDRFLGAVARRSDEGVIGVTGPHGSGKSTLIQRYVRGVQAAGQAPAPLVVFATCPVRYEARDFVLHLHATACRAVLDRVRPTGRPPTRLDRPRGVHPWSALLRVVSALGIAGASLTPFAPGGSGTPALWWAQPLLALAGSSLAFATSTLVRALRDAVIRWWRTALVALVRLVKVVTEPSRTSVPVPSRGHSVDDLAREARESLHQIRVLQTSTTGWSGKFLPNPVLAVGYTDTVELAERPLTHPEVVDAFKFFLRRCVEVLGSVVVAVDEVDKIVPTERAQAFIDDLKGVFGVPNCLYAMSIPETALIGDRGVRDAFDEVVLVDHLDLADSLKLLHNRVIGISDLFGCLFHCASGGLPGALVHVVRQVVEHRKDSVAPSLAEVCRELVRSDISRSFHELRLAADRHGAAHCDLLPDQPSAETTSDLLALTADLLRRPSPDSGDPTLDRLRAVAAVHAYHGATLLQTFTDDVDEHLVRRARDEVGFAGSFDRLARARAAIAEQPHLAESLLDGFREAWALPSACR
jgi:hypothetical protein